MNPFDRGFVKEAELAAVGFRSVGNNVAISRDCTIIGPENISIGDNVRIDPFTTLIAPGSGFLQLGSYIHVGSFCHLSAGDGIVLADFVGLSQGTKIYSRSDDYSGQHLTGPMVPAQLTGITRGVVTLERHVLLGAGTVVLPKVTIGEGSSIGALSLVTRSLKPWGVWFGTPVKWMTHRSKRLLELERQINASS